MADEVDEWGRECELNPPRLVHFDSWGCRVDHIVTCPAWKRMKDLSAQEGLVAIGYERSFGEWRLVEWSGPFAFSLRDIVWKFLHMKRCGVCLAVVCTK